MYTFSRIDTDRIHSRKLIHAHFFHHFNRMYPYRAKTCNLNTVKFLYPKTAKFCWRKNFVFYSILAEQFSAWWAMLYLFFKEIFLFTNVFYIYIYNLDYFIQWNSIFIYYYDWAYSDNKQCSAATSSFSDQLSLNAPIITTVCWFVCHLCFAWYINTIHANNPW